VLRRWHRLAGTGVLGIASLVGVAACGGGGSGGAGTRVPILTGAQAHDPTLLAGRKVYAAECASCHGSHGQGGVGTPFDSGRLLRDFPNAEDQVTFVANGKGVMPAFGSGILTRKQIETVVAYERQVLSAR
jgi:mono/diheme cytochrome c family protein